VIVALLPAKPLELAKSRLATLLDPPDRMAVAHAMFGDVLSALGRSRALDAVLVVTADPTLARDARRAGAILVDEGTARGLNAAVNLGTGAAVRLGASAVLVVLSDVPLLAPVDVDDLCARAPGQGALLVPSKEGTGTNAMLRRPPSAIGPRFGGRSLERHAAAAERQHLPCVIARSDRVGFDVDTPEDLRLFAETESDTVTYREAVRLGLGSLRPSA
jgi:2-phospho-L-lactate guanylyltransferase